MMRALNWPRRRSTRQSRFVDQHDEHVGAPDGAGIPGILSIESSVFGRPMVPFDFLLGPREDFLRRARTGTITTHVRATTTTDETSRTSWHCHIVHFSGTGVGLEPSLKKKKTAFRILGTQSNPEMMMPVETYPWRACRSVARAVLIAFTQERPAALWTVHSRSLAGVERDSGAGRVTGHSAGSHQRRL